MAKYRKMLSVITPAMDELMSLLSTQSKTTIANWSINYAEDKLLPIWLSHYPGDDRPGKAIDAARDWLQGKVKLPEVKKIILNECHAAAKENDNNPAAQTAARGIGQAAATIHASSHSLGIALYGALSIAYDKLGFDAPWAELEQFANRECDSILASLKLIAVENEPNPAKIKWSC